jgi:acyl-coenzyme A synthetase/AMP-(fatty) acid ligase/acyl carrier protein
MLDHASLCNLAFMQASRLDVVPESRVLQFSSFSFDACTWEIAMTLCRGACLCLGSRDEIMPGEPLLNTLQRLKITHATLPPVALGAAQSRELPSLTTLVVAGEVCSPALVRQWGSGRRFINAYGPTEGTVCATMHDCLPRESGIVPIGKPIPNARIYILDVFGEPVPIGVTGEMYIGGAGVARGYLGRPALTAERFVADLFTSGVGQRLYRTGDLGRWRADGVVEYLGRNDRQVKIRGYRIEVGEIEAQLLRHPLVSEAIVVQREDTPGERRLVGYLVLHSKAKQTDSEAAARSLRLHLKETLPEYMLPALFVFVDGLPLTANGKLDQSALPIPKTISSAGRMYEEPRGDLERKLASIWQRLLRVERIGRSDDFFELGGHSLLATRVITEIRETLDAEIPIRVFFESPTIEQQATAIVQSQSAAEVEWDTSFAAQIRRDVAEMDDVEVLRRICELERRST